MEELPGSCELDWKQILHRSLLLPCSLGMLTQTLPPGWCSVRRDWERNLLSKSK